MNQYRDDYRFGKQHRKQILASPGNVDLERFRISQKNVSFKLISAEEEAYEYIAPQAPAKPFCNPDWKALSKSEKSNCYSAYNIELKEYKNLLRPNIIESSSDIPESVSPNFIAVGNPYPNILAFSLYDIRDEILENLKEHPEIDVSEGILKNHILGR